MVQEDTCRVTVISPHIHTQIRTRLHIFIHAIDAQNLHDVATSYTSCMTKLHQRLLSVAYGCRQASVRRKNELAGAFVGS